MTHSRPERRPDISSHKQRAVGGSLPSLRVLLENRMSNGGRRWRMGAGLLVQVALLSLLLLLPLLLVDRLDPQVPTKHTILVIAVQKGEPEGAIHAREKGAAENGKPGQQRPRILPDFSGKVRFPIPNSDVATPDVGDEVLTAGFGSGDVRLGLPEGSEGGFLGLRPVGPLVQPPAPPPPVQVGGRVRAPRLVRQLQPEYPEIARHAGIEGDVVLEALLGADGPVKELKLVRGHILLARAAQRAVGQWLFEPTYLNNEPVPVLLKVVVQFRLNR